MSAKVTENLDLTERGTIQMVYRAVKNRWPISEDVRQGIATMAVKLGLTQTDADGKPADPRVQLRALQILVSMERSNQIDQLAALASGIETDKAGQITETPQQVAERMRASIPYVPPQKKAE